MSISARTYDATYSAEFMASCGIGPADEPLAVRLSRRKFSCVRTLDDARQAAHVVTHACRHPDYDSIRTRFIEYLRQNNWYLDVLPFFLAEEDKMMHNGT